MDLLDRLLMHDAWTTGELLRRCADLSDDQLDREFDIGRRTLRATFDHVIRNMEVWSGLMEASLRESIFEDGAEGAPGSATVATLMRRLDAAAARLASVARTIAEREAWDETWLDTLDDPPTRKTYGGAIAHVIAHSMHHRAQILHMLRRLGVPDLPEGDVLSWERDRGSS